jgi:signal transduction histidine kinase
MRERVAELGGTWEITSPEGGGTSIRVSLPIINKEAA